MDKSEEVLVFASSVQEMLNDLSQNGNSLF